MDYNKINKIDIDGNGNLTLQDISGKDITIYFNDIEKFRQILSEANDNLLSEIHKLVSSHAKINQNFETVIKKFLAENDGTINFHNQVSTITNKVKNEIIKYKNAKGFPSTIYREAINLAYFIFKIYSLLNDDKSDEYKELLQTIFNTFTQDCFNDGAIFGLNSQRLIILERETSILFEAMQKDDENSGYWSNSSRAANMIKNTKINYQNYLYGQLLEISYKAHINTNLNKHANIAYAKVFNFVKQELFKEDALEESVGGWKLYRLPWVTARILIASSSVAYTEFSTEELQVVKKAIVSLLDRRGIGIEFKNYWSSGARGWNSWTESTALCLEALMRYEKVFPDLDNDIQLALNAAFNDLLIEQNKLISETMFGEDLEKNSNSVSNIMLLSVLFRIIQRYYKDAYRLERENILKVFYDTVKVFNSKEIITRQTSGKYTTITYILLAISEL